MDRRFYPDFGKNWDDHLFRGRILAVLNQDAAILDLGAGAGIVEQMDFRGHASRICGLDLDPRVAQNPMLDEGKEGDAAHIPWPDASFDVVFADNVVEHLDEPSLVFAEVARVLKPGGTFLFKTPNKWHYMPLIARCTPHRFHQFVNRKRGRAEADTFPTRYRANSRGMVMKLARNAGYDGANIERIEGRPEYLRMSWPTYLCGVLYERVVNSTSVLSAFRVLLIAQLRKRA
jgi:SAM-dependent methyltransferase